MIPREIDGVLIDTDKTKLWLNYLARAYKRIEDREFAHKKLQVALKQLRKVSTKSLKKHIDELEGHVHEAVAKERQIITRQTEEDVLHKDLKSKIDRLEHKLTRYLQTQEARKQRVAELEAKIKERTMSKREKTRALKADLVRLQRMYRKAKASKKYSHEQLDRIACRIKVIAGKITASK
jgi:chromosome segregation ATPase